MTQSGEPFDPYYHWLGIPPEEQPPNHYRLLGIQPLEENQEVIQNAADRQMAHLRTFQGGPRGTASQKILNEVSAARVCLLSAERKTAYDEQFRATVASANSAPPAVAPNAIAPPDASNAEADQGMSVGPPVVRTVDSTPTPMVRATRPRQHSRLPLLIVLAVVGLLATGIVVVAVNLGAGKPSAKNRLVLNWPVARRAGATVDIDGQPVDLSAAAANTDDTVEFQLEPGRHSYRISRPPFKVLEGQFTLQLDERVELDVVFSPLSVKQLGHAGQGGHSGELLLIWPESARDGFVLELDGRPCDLTADRVQDNGSQLRIAVSRGLHRVALAKEGGERIEWTIDSRVSKPFVLSSTATIVLHWSASKRKGCDLFIDGLRIDLADPSISDNGTELVLTVPPGKKSLQIKRDDSLLLSVLIPFAAGRRYPIFADKLIDRRTPHLLLQWPVDERTNAILEVDGVKQTLPTGTAADDASIMIDVEAGEHTIRITRPDHDVFERTVTIRDRGTFAIRVDAQRIIAATIDEEELSRLRESHVKTYTQYGEFRTWSEETDPANKRRALSTLISKMTREASNLTRSSPEQYVAYDQTYRLAAEQNQLVTADGILRTLRASRCIDDKELSKRQLALRSRAVSEADFQAALALLKSASYADTKLTTEEEVTLCKRISESPDIQQDYQLVERTVDSFSDAGLLTPNAACQLHAAVLLQASKAAQFEPISSLGIAEEMLVIVPDLLKMETETALLTADSLIDEANGIRRKVLADRRSPTSLRKRVDALAASAKEMQERVTQYRRVVEARGVIAAGEGTGAQHKLLGLWLLQHVKYDEALPHLRQSGDTTLAAIAIALPDTADELTELADAIESESKKTKYLKRYELALRDYASHVRQLALSRTEGTTAVDASEHAKTPTETGASQLDWEGLPKGKWQRLLKIVSLNTLRQIAESPVEGTWNVADDGTITSSQRAQSRFELPIALQGSYAIRCVCRVTDGDDISINLPLGERSVLFTMGAVNGRYSGLQLIDGQGVESAVNPSSINRSAFRLRRGIPVHVEIHVELMPTSEQSAKQRRTSGGKDWVQIAVILNGKAIGGVSTATARFSVPPNQALSAGAIGFSTGSAASYGSIELMRK